MLPSESYTLKVGHSYTHSLDFSISYIHRLSKVHIEKEDEENGVVLTPSKQTVTVKHSVVTDIKFSQFVTTLRGSVNCLGKSRVRDAIVTLT